MKKIVVCLCCMAVCAGFCLPVFAASENLTNQVERTAASAQLSFATTSYIVEITSYFKKEILLKDRMLRAPRHPANPKQVISVEKAAQSCEGVVVSKGARVIVPAVCVSKADYVLNKIVIRLKTGDQLTVMPGNMMIDEDIAWLSVHAAQTRGVPYVAFEPVAQGKSLQEVYGNDMTRRLQQFFRERGVVEHRRLRPGLIYREPRLKVGEPLFYKGKLVALVKKQVRTYGGLFGGVSEDALALIR